jgi:hypothetical protein
MIKNCITKRVQQEKNIGRPEKDGLTSYSICSFGKVKVNLSLCLTN